MSTLVSTRSRGTDQRASIATLALIEVRRYARHPLFLVGLALMALAAFVPLSRDDIPGSPVDLAFYPVFFIGTFGVIVAYRLAKSIDVAGEVADAAPVHRADRTAALCLATLFPAAVGAVATVVMIAVGLVTWSNTTLWDTGIDSVTLVAALLAGVVACAGGPLFGIVVARWTNFPGAGLVAVVALVAWTLSGTVGLAMAEPSRLSALLHLQTPWVGWTSSDGPGMQQWLAEGSVPGQLAYAITLCLLGATFAIVHDAQGEQRRRLWRLFAVLAAVAVLLLGASVLGEPVRQPLNLVS